MEYYEITPEAACQKSAGLERLDLIDFSVILCIEKEGKKCKKVVKK